VSLSKRGVLLVEASMACVIISVALVALVPTLVLSLKANKAAEQMKAATQLSTELLEEIRLRRWDELTPLPPQSIASGSSVLGIDTGENAADKRTFNDIDDFNGWTENPPKDPMMLALTGIVGYSRSVTVRYVDSVLSNSAIPTNYKQVTVCTQEPKGASVCLDTLFTNR
jgi:type II secretory pathway pseudopilin PulG